MLQFGLRLGDAPAPGRHDDAADDPADPAARRRARRRDDDGAHRRQCRKPRAGVSGAGHGGVRRHAARAPGARGRADRGPARRAVAARGDRGGAGRGGAGAHAHRGRGRSAGDLRPRCRRLRHRRGGDRCGRHGLRHRRRDASRGVAPEAWAAQAVALYRRLEADALVAEVNQGGDMVAAVLRVVDPRVPVTSVVATRGKYARAEPVSALYAQGRVRHVGAFPALEDEMCDFGPAGLLERPLARPARRARLGADPPHAGEAGGAAPAGALARERGGTGRVEARSRRENISRTRSAMTQAKQARERSLEPEGRPRSRL